jgi:hypothetical protein
MYRVQYIQYLKVHNGHKNVYKKINNIVTEAELLKLQSNPYVRILDIEEVLE